MRIPTSPRDRKRSSGAWTESRRRSDSSANGGRSKVPRRDGAAPARSFAGAFARANARSRSWSPRRTASGVSLPGARVSPTAKARQRPRRRATLGAARQRRLRRSGRRRGTNLRASRAGEDRGFDASYHDSRSAETEARPPRRLAALAGVLLTAPGDLTSQRTEKRTLCVSTSPRGVAALDGDGASTEASTEASARTPPLRRRTRRSERTPQGSGQF